jgi:hypothetical protein
VADSGDVGESPAIAIGKRWNPVIAYALRDGSPRYSNLRVAGCADATCSSATLTSLESGRWIGEYNSIAIGNDGNPCISTWGESGEELLVIMCTDPMCTDAARDGSGYIGNSLGLTGGKGKFSSMAIGADGNPVIAYYDTSAENPKLMIAICADTSCTSATTQLIAETTLHAQVSVVIDDGTPLSPTRTAVSTSRHSDAQGRKVH